ncbi:3-isopropylmalate dehydratase large subunit [Syntrophus aciditrophicus]|uniref:3-isopropylmalate dehydratase large subunit n=1 Tax=Syntrophus aciditrophicus (strain SB) TaxID=56780 RepID=LEUC_SYNAS|nr:3-isopropylmalate dehydratase large subunit [Syntrophus aciditrophicus]Q2LWJ2.1 RecName: Full=3-isopropylmalate dehydratase large subunit; AltName: Full=Alpha-IPM isomerase; Short=IPMI; AltName: Full=Isopropylmalate isomerase [Syntrophus aciditrophicus SB]ABC78450.1 3-isopropylmalate dehydratase large subunit [Syntrophus aciditrophicus SB]OPY18036.1 MAG: 2,3-dimethylmalate dehydratase large subunit [Syntrophus sp. PtaB.Bin075]
MGMTITEKILCRHTDLDEVRPGMLINAKVDIALGNDVTAPLAIDEFRKAGGKKVFDRDKVVLIPDHFTPNKDINSAAQCKIMRDFAREQEITHYYEVGEVGVEHALLPEKGIVLPGDLVIGADSHTCTYGALGAFATGVGSTDLAAAMLTGEVWFKVPESIRFVLSGTLNPWVSGKDLILYIIGKIGVDGALYKAMEFTGDTIASLTMADRFTIANMAIEAGGKNGIFTPDEITEAYVKPRAKRPYTFYASDPDAAYAQVIEIDVNRIEPQVAFPHLPSNTKGISEVGQVPLDQVVIGSCTNGRIEDLRAAAAVLKGRKADPRVRLIVIPATQEIYRMAMKEGLFDIFLDANAAISTPTCGPCLGGHMGILAAGERALATTNRNFVGRMGHPRSEVYLSNPAVAAASAVLGRIAGPDELK